MDALGFDLYTQMLERTVAELRGEAVEDETNVAINLGIDVAIPDDYINDMGQRLRTYKRVSSARDEDTLSSIREEIRDRYGRLPESVDHLFGYALLRRLAEDIGVLSIDKTTDGVALKFSEKARISPDKLAKFVSSRAGRLFSPTGVLRLNLNDDEHEQLLDTIRGALLELRSEDSK
jgi:transcription-repair coupling factor (superfamily II helicase)